MKKETEDKKIEIVDPQTAAKTAARMAIEKFCGVYMFSVFTVDEFSGYTHLHSTSYAYSAAIMQVCTKMLFHLTDAWETLCDAAKEMEYAFKEEYAKNDYVFVNGEQWSSLVLTMPEIKEDEDYNKEGRDLYELEKDIIFRTLYCKRDGLKMSYPQESLINYARSVYLGGYRKRYVDGAVNIKPLLFAAANNLGLDERKDLPALLARDSLRQIDYLNAECKYTAYCCRYENLHNVWKEFCASDVHSFDDDLLIYRNIPILANVLEIDPLFLEDELHNAMEAIHYRKNMNRPATIHELHYASLPLVAKLYDIIPDNYKSQCEYHTPVDIVARYIYDAYSQLWKADGGTEPPKEVPYPTKGGLLEDRILHAMHAAIEYAEKEVEMPIGDIPRVQLAVEYKQEYWWEQELFDAIKSTLLGIMICPHGFMQMVRDAFPAAILRRVIPDEDSMSIYGKWIHTPLHTVFNKIHEGGPLYEVPAWFDKHPSANNEEYWDNIPDDVIAVDAEEDNDA